MTNSQTHEFQTEVQQLLHLMIHSLYSDKEIFLRELISNASDACDKLRFSALTDNSLLEDQQELAITLDIDKENRTLTITDNGIGMTRDEVIENIGTIARSGTKNFLNQLTGDESKDTNLIGQFGVGFYSVFMVADKVTLTTRAAGQPVNSAVKWVSDGSGSYTIDDVTQDTRGTCIKIELRKDEDEFLDPTRLQHIINKYSDHVSLPIQMPKMDGDKPEESGEYETINKGSALWTRAKQDISEDEYQSFYSTLSYDPEKPLSILHNRVEGNLEYTSLFFIPTKAPFDLWDREQRHGIKLYVKRIFILDDAKHLMPNYLRFVRGVVDCADLPLNVSREILQKNRQIDKIKSGSVKKILAEITRIANKDPDAYQNFWNEFGQVLKEGMVEDTDNQKQLSELIRFTTTESNDEMQTVSLKQYCERMATDQSEIYYLSGDKLDSLKSSPHLELFKKKNIEVILLTDPVDEWLVSHLTEYDDKPLKSVAKGDIELSNDDEEKLKTDKAAKDTKPLVTKIQELLADQVKEVRITNRLTDSPACLVADEHDLGGNMERILKAMGQSAPESKPILELNPDHKLIKSLDADQESLPQWAQILFDQAALAEGVLPANPNDYVRRVNDLLINDAKESVIVTP